LSQLNQAESFWAEQAKQVELELLSRNPENKPRPRLEPTARAVSLLGDPQRSYRVIHITGTNGKTSTARLIERLLRETGLRTGRFTSPHLVSFNERISIDGEPVSDEVLVEVWRDIAPVLEIVDAQLEAEGEAKLTYFEALAVLGFAVFADAPVDVLVLEVGMGGEWDSTNVADGDVAVFAPIGLDHTDRIGSTVAEIARTKAGIIKPDSIVVSASQPPEAEAELVAKAKLFDAPIRWFGSDFELTATEATKIGQTLSVKSLAGTYEDLTMPIHGYFQAENAALAIAAVEAFLGGGQHRLMDDVVRVALADVASPGRLQVIEQNPLVLLDGAHNPHGAKALASALSNSFEARETVAVISMLEQKDLAGFLQNLDPAVTHYVVTQSSSDRALSAEVLAERISAEVGKGKVSVQVNFASALEQARGLLSDSTSGAVLVTGSLTLVGDALAMIQREAELDG
jgi:dihydrofolate synthase/folylpolyglutamate synthase